MHFPSVSCFLFLFPYFTPSSLRKIPVASLWASVSNLWRVLQARKVNRAVVVHGPHERLGKYAFSQIMYQSQTRMQCTAFTGTEVGCSRSIIAMRL